MLTFRTVSFFARSKLRPSLPSVWRSVKYIYIYIFSRWSFQRIVPLSLSPSPPSFRDPHTFNCYIYKGGRAWRCVVIPGRRDTTAFFFSFLLFFFSFLGTRATPRFCRSILSRILIRFSRASLSVSISLHSFRSWKLFSSFEKILYI